MQKLCYFTLRWIYRIVMFLAVVMTIGIATDKEIVAWVKVVVVVFLLLLFTVPDYFPNVFRKAKRKAMTGIEYEKFCAKKLTQKGFRSVKVTPSTGDYGADLVAVDKHGHKWVVQCKRYTRKVGNAAVQEIVAAKAHYGADKAAVMTNSQLTANAKKLAFENDVILFELVDE